jgi:hypothetical protein
MDNKAVNELNDETQLEPLERESLLDLVKSDSVKEINKFLEDAKGEIENGNLIMTMEAERKKIELINLLSDLDLLPFKTDSVDKYQEAILFKYNATLNSISIAISLSSIIIVLFTFFLGSRTLSGITCSILFLIQLVSFLVCRSQRVEWKSILLRDYNSFIPLQIAEKIIKIHKAIPDSEFYIIELNRPKQTKQDVFLELNINVNSKNISCIIEHWFRE